MSIAFDARCCVCRLQRNLDTAYTLGDAQTADAFARELLRLYLDAPRGVSSVSLGPAEEALFRRFYGDRGDRFAEEKRQSNEFVLHRLPKLREAVSRSEEPLRAALQFALLGNYIDYSALHGEVSFDTLDALLARAQAIAVDEACFASLKRDLAHAAHLVYLTDNAGEIGFDRLLAETMHAAYPNVQITFCVRGGNVLNDATRADAAFLGVPFPVIDSGCALAGTDLAQLAPEAREAVMRADILLAKGQGNAETLFGCGLNVYYAFLAKCVRFTELLGVRKLTAVFLRERAEP